MSASPDYSEKFAKVDLTLISSVATEAEGRVLMHGDSKYARRSYLERPGYDIEAFRGLLRHVAAIMKGEQYDAETGQHHLAHIRANTGIILECWESHNEEPSARWPHEPAKPRATESAPQESESQSTRALRMTASSPDDPSISKVLESSRPSQCTCGRGALRSKAVAPLLIPQSRSCE